MELRFVPQEEIDRQLYDSCVHFATNGSIYGYHWFLNATAKDWDVLVEGDEWVSVMPLPRSKNWWGRQRLEQPGLIPELAVYSVRPLSPTRIQAFWDAIPAEFRGGELTVEPASVPAAPGRFKVHRAAGEALFLDQPYETLVAGFGPDYFNRLQLAEAAGLRPASSFKPERLADLWLETQGRSATNEWQYHAMQRIMYQVLHRSWGGTQAVQDATGELLAMVFIAYSHGRIFPLFRVESVQGRSVGAMTYLWDQLLRTHAGKNLKIKREDLW
ncbi:hypothetical protein QWY85_04795 [Neolewinella lacunae]|uniref:BioF2-like acetyltransferase domain-containing protein n=1 Tax=Neolewinella lacunae TaxID=1517758 RepID=A0A923PL20_9BACT|nr:hypothetical protein [Neolewinella lacunae]MBC6996113.1 hypothetical protein [Neolewinella lacunae]MDN3633966.1 hypothetical protein [Neolewinella lacunae]